MPITDSTWISRARTPTAIVMPARTVHGFKFRPDVDGPVITAAQRPLESLVAVGAPELLVVAAQESLTDPACPIEVTRL